MRGKKLFHIPSGTIPNRYKVIVCFSDPLEMLWHIKISCLPFSSPYQYSIGNSSQHNILDRFCCGVYFLSTAILESPPVTTAATGWLSFNPWERSARFTELNCWPSHWLGVPENRRIEDRGASGNMTWGTRDLNSCVSEQWALKTHPF